jgi:hypothetical protein
VSSDNSIRTRHAGAPNASTVHGPDHVGAEGAAEIRANPDGSCGCTGTDHS